jgi:sulfur-carrier protein
VTEHAAVAARVVRVVLPAPLRALVHLTGEVALPVTGPLSLRAVLDALESAYPALRGTIRDHGTHKRRAFVRFYACEQDLSLASPDDLLPEAVQNGQDPLLIVGAMAGG